MQIKKELVQHMFSYFSRVRLSATLWTVACLAPLSMGFSRQEYWSGLPCPPPGAFPDQGSNLCLLHHLHCRQIFLVLSHQIRTDQSLSHVRLFVTPWIAACQASLSITNSRSSLRLVHRVSDAIQPSHPLSSPSPLAPNPSQNQSLLQWVNSSHEVAKVLEFQL